MKTALVTVNYNGGQMLLDTLASLYSNTSPNSFDLYLVDNASSDGSAENAKSLYPQIELIRSKENLGFGKGNNLALSRILSEKKYSYVGLINNDMYFTEAG